MPMDGSGGAGGRASSSMLPAYGRVQPQPFWSTPTPYLFIGFAVVMGLIAVALVVLLCSRRREARGEEEAAAAGLMSVRVLVPLDREAPKVVVVMAGDDAPSFLASAAPLAFAEVAKVQQPYPYAGGKDADAV